MSTIENLPLDFTWYRTRFFLGLAQSLLPPISITYCLLNFVAHRPALDVASFFAYLISPCLWISITSRYSIWSHDRRARQLGAVPIPRVQGKWPGNIDVMLRFAKDLREGYILQAMTELLDEHNCNSLNTRILWKDNIITRDDLHMRAVHATSFEFFERGFEAREKMGTFLGHGVFVTDREQWKHNRALVRPFLSRERVSDFEILTKHSDHVLSILASSPAPLDIQDLFLRFTLDSNAEFLLGITPGALSLPRPQPFKARLGPKGSATDDAFGTFRTAFEEVQVDMSLRWRLGSFWPLYELFGDRTLKHVDVIMRWIRPVVGTALTEKAAARKRDMELRKEERTLLDSLVDNTDDEETVRYGLLNVLMASRDSTATLMTYVMYFLCEHPDVRERLRTEIFEVLGPSGIPTHDSLRKMTYMNAVLNESLRLFPPAPLGIRNSLTEVLLAPPGASTQPLYLPAGARVTWLTLLLHRRADLWGPDADTFDPGRWLDSRAARVTDRPSMFVPFLSGPRTCPGQPLALAEAAFMLTRVVQRFPAFALAPEALPAGAAPPTKWRAGRGRQRIERCWPSTAFTAFVKGGLWVRVEGTEAEAETA